MFGHPKFTVIQGLSLLKYFYFIPKSTSIIDFLPCQTTFEPILGLMSAPAPRVQALMFFRGCWSDTLTCLRCMKPWLLCCWEIRPVTLQGERWVSFHLVNHPLHQSPSSCFIVHHLQVHLDDVLQSLIDSQADTPAQQLCVEAATILLELVKCIITQVIL